MIRKEYGGFLPLELNHGEEWFLQFEKPFGRFNSVKAAFDFVLKKLAVKRIYIPYYYCPSTTEAIKEMVDEVHFYHVDEGLMPLEVPDEVDSAVLLVDFFGVRQAEISNLAKGFSRAEVILDYAHDFFAEPILTGKTHCVYSAKKFFGIPDGAYLVSPLAGTDCPPMSKASSYAGYLLKTYEEGTNAAYREKKISDELIASNYRGMSQLSLGLLQNADYRSVLKRRTDNWKVLLESLQSQNLLQIPDSCPAYQFPFLPGETGEALKKKLVENKIYVSTLWSGKDLLEQGTPFELSMSKNAVFLPMDQRYDAEDMKYIVCKVQEILGGML